jgi:uncharacterized protein YceK
MRHLTQLIFLGGLCTFTGCSAIGSRVIGDRYFSGVRADTAMLFDRERFDPTERVHPVLAVVDMPFSLVGDILFLPYDACRGGQPSCIISNASVASSHEK